MRERVQEPRISIGTRIELPTGVVEVVKIRGVKITNSVGDSVTHPTVTLKNSSGTTYEVDGQELAQLI